APAGAARLHGVHHAQPHDLQVVGAGTDRYRRRLRHVLPLGLESGARLRHQVRTVQHAAGQAGTRARQLQGRHLPVALADAGIDGVAGVPALAARDALGFGRRQDALDLSDQVDAGRLAEAVLAHVPGEALDPEVQRQAVVIRVHRARNRTAQVGPAVAAAAGIAPAAAGAGQVE